MKRLYLPLLAGTFLVCCVCPPLAAQDSSPNASSAEDPFAIPESNEGLPGVGPIRRYPWFQDLWQKRRSTWASRIAQDQRAVVFLGDSITQGWGDQFGESFDDLKVANRGISGDTTRGMLLRLEEDVLALNPRAVVLLMGTNDLEEGASPEQVAENFETIIARLKKHDPELPIVVNLVFPSSASKSRPADKIQEVNRRMAQAVRGDGQVTVLDTWTLFADKQGDAKPSEFPDLLHPNKVGYQKWAGALRPILATLELLELESTPTKLEDGFESLFNGYDLTGWCLRPTTPQMLTQRERWQSRDPNAPPWPIVKERVDLTDAQATPDGRYRALHGRLVVSSPPEGRKIQQLWTTREFDHDFELRLEFRATPNADSGVFLRGKQLQCRDFPLAGPYQDLEKFRQGDWNELTVVVRGQQANCTCNGETLEADFPIPASGPIGLEGDRGQLEYRHIRIRPLKDK